MTTRKQAEARKAQSGRWAEMERAPAGVERIAVLLAAVQPGRAPRPPARLRDRRRIWNQNREQWVGVAGTGRCQACGRGPRARCWHHILPLSLGGGNGRKNRIRICEECHAQVHLHLRVPAGTDEGLYRRARAVRPALPGPRLIKADGTVVVAEVTAQR